MLVFFINALLWEKIIAYCSVFMENGVGQEFFYLYTLIFKREILQ